MRHPAFVVVLDMKLYWFDVHKIIAREAQAEFERSVSGTYPLADSGLVGIRIASRVCRALERCQGQRDDDGEQERAVDDDQQQRDRFQIPADG